MINNISDMAQAALYYFTVLLLNDEGVCWADCGNNNDKTRTPFARINLVDAHATSSNHHVVR